MRGDARFPRLTNSFCVGAAKCLVLRVLADQPARRRMVCRGANSKHQGHGVVEEVSKYMAAACAYQFCCPHASFCRGWPSTFVRKSSRWVLVDTVLLRTVSCGASLCVQRSSLHGTSTTSGYELLLVSSLHLHLLCFDVPPTLFVRLLGHALPDSICS